MTDWLEALRTSGQQGGPCVLITVAKVQGSAPRDAGTKMIVTGRAVTGTIGGGHLEFKAIARARELLASGPPFASELHRFALGPSLGQCCGGVVFLLLERIEAALPDWVPQLQDALMQHPACVLVSVAGQAAGAAAKAIVTADAVHGAWPGGVPAEDVLARARSLLADPRQPAVLLSAGDPQRQPAADVLLEPVRVTDFQVMLFGAGHVGRALVHILSALPCRVTWVDSREEPFPDSVPPNIQRVETEDPVFEVRQAPPATYFLVLTHSHALDYALCEAILARQDFRFFGLIGSKSKRNQFERRLLHKGFSPALLASMTCPIGVTGIHDKHPAAIAVAVVAQLLQVHEQAQQATAPHPSAQVTVL